MTDDEFKVLGRGDIIRHVGGGDSLLVDANYGKHVAAVRTQHVSNPREWVLVMKAKYLKVED